MYILTDNIYWDLYVKNMKWKKKAPLLSILHLQILQREQCECKKIPEVCLLAYYSNIIPRGKSGEGKGKKQNNKKSRFSFVTSKAHKASGTRDETEMKSPFHFFSFIFRYGLKC